MELRTEEGRMHAKSPTSSAIDRKIDIRLTPRSVAPNVLLALQALGYTFREDLDKRDPDSQNSGIWIVDRARLEDVPTPDIAPNIRILMIASPRQNQYDDSRVLVMTKRPARLSAVYSMIQSALEHMPRKTPRVRTQLSARFLKEDRRSMGALLSLSEGGCLLRTSESLREGVGLDLQFALPEYGLVSTRAECRYIRKASVGLQFLEAAQDIRHSIGNFVTSQLAEAEARRGIGGVGGARPA